MSILGLPFLCQGAMGNLIVWLAAAGLALLCGLLLIRRQKGVKATNGPAAEDVHPFGDQSSHTSLERRESPRRWGDPVQVLILGADHSSEPIRGWTLNRSAGGLGLSAPEPVQEGAILNVRASLAPDSVPWVQIEVMSCHPLAGRWVLGCRFISRPPDDVRLIFR